MQGWLRPRKKQSIIVSHQKKLAKWYFLLITLSTLYWCNVKKMRGKNVVWCVDCFSRSTMTQVFFISFFKTQQGDTIDLLKHYLQKNKKYKIQLYTLPLWVLKLPSRGRSPIRVLYLCFLFDINKISTQKWKHIWKVRKKEMK